MYVTWRCVFRAGTWAEKGPLTWTLPLAPPCCEHGHRSLYPLYLPLPLPLHLPLPLVGLTPWKMSTSVAGVPGLTTRVGTRNAQRDTSYTRCQSYTVVVGAGAGVGVGAGVYVALCLPARLCCPPSVC
jgi:hypothetical protein